MTGTRDKLHEISVSGDQREGSGRDPRGLADQSRPFGQRPVQLVSTSPERCDTRPSHSPPILDSSASFRTSSASSHRFGPPIHSNITLVTNLLSTRPPTPYRATGASWSSLAAPCQPLNAQRAWPRSPDDPDHTLARDTPIDQSLRDQTVGSGLSHRNDSLVINPLLGLVGRSVSPTLLRTSSSTRTIAVIGHRQLSVGEKRIVVAL